ncbi:MAG TPA: outer membrane protein transport protein [Candidatus Binatia bacterium]|nr:outer membrane protein transport protein [Candidatus Binatia bacterium]
MHPWIEICKVFLLILLGLFYPKLSFAGGYAIPPQTARAESMGGAATAGVEDPSAVYVNPAAMTQIDGDQIMTGVTYVNTVSSVRNGRTTSRNIHDDDALPNVFINYHVPNSKISLGIGSYSPFGLATSYKPDSFARYAAIRSELKTLFVTPAIAWEALPYLSVGGGLSFVHSSGLFSRAIFFGPFGDGRLRITDTDNAYGYNFGLLVKPQESLRIGVTYRSRVALDFDSADVKFTDAPLAGGLGTRAKASGMNLPLPPVINLGAHWQVDPKWGLEFEFDFVRWSEFRQLKASFSTPLPGLGGAFPIMGFVLPQKWKDATTLRFGTSYKLNPNFELRAGAALEETPIPASTLGPAIPGADYLSLTGGIGYKWRRLKVDLGYMAVLYKTRRVTNNVLETGGDPNALPFPGLSAKDKHRIFQNLLGMHAAYTF